MSGGLIALLGWGIAPYLVLQAVVGFSLLEIVNYMEHYGMLRMKVGKPGKERYEQIKGQASQLWSSPKTQKAVGQAKDTVQTQAPVVADKVTGAAKDAAGTVKDKVSRSEDLPETIHRGDDGELHADTSGFGPGGDKLP